MPRINQKLLAAIIKKTGLSNSQVYARIQQTANSETLPRDLAAIKVGAEVGVTINKYANEAQLAQLRQAGTPVTPPRAEVHDTGGRVRIRKAVSGAATRRAKGQIPNAVFVVHGRDTTAKKSIFTYQSVEKVA